MKKAKGNLALAHSDWLSEILAASAHATMETAESPVEAAYAESMRRGHRRPRPSNHAAAKSSRRCGTMECRYWTMRGEAPGMCIHGRPISSTEVVIEANAAVHQWHTVGP